MATGIAIVRLTKWEVDRLLEALESGPQRSEDHDVWIKLRRAADRLARRQSASTAD